MNKYLLAGVSAVALMVAVAAPASAGDLYRREAVSVKDSPAPIWQGLYIGAHVGGAWGEVKGKSESDRGSIDANGVIGGAQIGYNFQQSSMVYGLEADLGGLDLSGSLNDNGTRFSSSAGLYGDITGRLGIAAGNTLFYAKGGAAFFNGNFKVTDDQGVSASDNPTFWGWTAGAGVEHMWRPDWSVKLEYQHFDFGNENVFTAYTNNVKFNPTADAVTFGVNYHFNREAGSLK